MNYLWFYLLFYGSLGAGILLRPWQKSSGYIMRGAVLCLDTPLFLYSFWILDINRVRQYAPVPVLAACLILIPLYLSPWWARRLLDRTASQGSFVLSSAFSNIGTTGGAFLCYLLYGLPGLSLGYLFLFPYPLLIFTLGFSTAKKYAGQSPGAAENFISNLYKNLFSLLPLAAIAAGLLLHILGVSPWAGLSSWADVWIKLDLGVMCLAIGMTLKFSHILPSLKPILALCSVKFILLPICALAMVLLVYGSWSPLAARVVLIQSAMPPAIYSVLLANLFSLDRDLANSLWFSATLMLIPIAGVLFWLAG